MGKIQIFIGKGGVGKSTCSSLYAVRCSNEGTTTLLDSFDPAHNLHDIFEMKFTGKEKKVLNNLFVRETDMNKISQNYMKGVKKDLKGLYHYQQALNIDKYFNILKFAPGMEEYAAWLALEACYNESRYDHIIIDTPPTALTMKTLALSSVNLHWLLQLESMRREIIEKKNSVSRIRKENLEQLDEDPVYIRLQRMKKRYEKMLEDLRDRERTEIVLILNEDDLSFAESLQIKKDLGELGIRIGRIIINKGFENSGWAEKITREFTDSVIEMVANYGSSVTGLDKLAKHCVTSRQVS